MSEESDPTHRFIGMFIGYFPNRVGSEFHAIMDGRGPEAVLQMEMYERVNRWVKKHGILLGEGWSGFSQRGEEYPVTMVMTAPAHSSKHQECFYELIEDPQLDD